ncbi:ThuA domain-containing protein [Microbacterium invictum]|uniref:ThuA-like domain-containing protein n=1 Tax=Microbacterium invictum TaxID=515415 RepID=A0AA40SS27_9MICO|nr:MULTISPECIES: ThuA domain-containing protein [Microbacterium]MBB4141180.1 hypothetical protein [Microbacterium invictum]
MRALIAVGTGRYADPWHPFAQVGARVADILTADGWDVDIDPDVDHALTVLDGVDLLVVAAGDPWADDVAAAPEASQQGLVDATARGLGILALHSATASLRGYPEWAQLTGAVWLPRVSMHPPFEEAAVVRVLPGHPLADGLGDFTVPDERYANLQSVGRSDVLADHEHEGVRYPLMWTREVGSARVAYDALGHDGRSYESESHREIVRRLARWVART